MSRMYFVVFILIALAIYGGIHYYLYRHIAHGLMLAPAGRLYLKLGLLALALIFICAEVLSHQYAMVWFKPVYKVGTIWFGVMGIALSVFVIADILSRLASGPPGPYRDKLTIIALAVAAVLSIYSVYNVARGPRIKTIAIKTPKLPDAIPCFTVVQISDLHLNFQKTEGWLDRVVDSVNGLNPDLVVITGDIADADIAPVKRFYSALKRLKSKHGIYAVVGNHDFYNGIDRFVRICRDLDIRTLRNEHVTISGAIELVGVDDDTGRSFGQNGADLSSALGKPAPVDFTRPVILLAHQPDIADEAVKAGVDLVLCGHTHWGQIPPMDAIVRLRYRYAYGLYQNGPSYIYTTTGTDIWGPPMRLFSRSEIVKITITAD